MTEEQLIAICVAFNILFSDKELPCAPLYSVTFRCNDTEEAQSMRAFACLHNYPVEYSSEGNPNYIRIG